MLRRRLSLDRCGGTEGRTAETATGIMSPATKPNNHSEIFVQMFSNFRIKKKHLGDA
jgi:hypothetical protein